MYWYGPVCCHFLFTNIPIFSVQKIIAMKFNKAKKFNRQSILMLSILEMMRKTILWTSENLSGLTTTTMKSILKWTLEKLMKYVKLNYSSHYNCNSCILPMSATGVIMFCTTQRDLFPKEFRNLFIVESASLPCFIRMAMLVWSRYLVPSFFSADNVVDCALHLKASTWLYKQQKRHLDASCPRSSMPL